MSIYEGQDVYLADVATVPTPALHLFACHWTQSEVQNGGLAQYFFNSTGVVAPDAVEGFRAMAMIEVADILNEAMTTFGPHYPRNRDDRLGPFGLPDVEDGRDAFQAFVAATSDRFEPLDDRLFALLADPNDGFLARADAYATEHRKNV